MIVRAAWKKEFYSILSDIEKNRASARVVDFSHFRLDDYHIGQLMDSLAFNQSVHKIILGKNQVSAAVLETLEGNNRRVCQIKGRNNKRKRDYLFRELPVPGPHQDHSRVLQFETELARCIIDNSSFDILYRINQAIINYLQANGYSNYHTLTDDELREFFLKLGYISTADAGRNLIEIFISLLRDTPLDIAKCITLHKAFVEEYLNPENIIVRQGDDSSKVKSLSYQCLRVLQRCDITRLDDNLTDLLRPYSQFSLFNRGRIKLEKVKSETRNFGITTREDCPDWAVNWHRTPVYPAKDVYQPDMTSTTIRFFNKHRIPFIAGPSGTAANCLWGMLILMRLSSSEIRDYINLLAAAEIAQGNHSYYEVMMIGANLKLFHTAQGFTDSGDASRTVAVSVSPAIDMGNIYASCLTDDIKACEDYKALAQVYPEYLQETPDRRLRR